MDTRSALPHHLLDNQRPGRLGRWRGSKSYVQEVLASFEPSPHAMHRMVRASKASHRRSERRSPRERRNELGETSVNKTWRKHPPPEEKSIRLRRYPLRSGRWDCPRHDERMSVSVVASPGFEPARPPSQRRWIAHVRRSDHCGLRRIAPVIAIRGNVDTDHWAERYPDTKMVRVGGRSIYVLHDIHELQLDPASCGVDMVMLEGNLSYSGPVSGARNNATA